MSSIARLLGIALVPIVFLVCLDGSAWCRDSRNVTGDEVAPVSIIMKPSKSVFLLGEPIMIETKYSIDLPGEGFYSHSSSIYEDVIYGNLVFSMPAVFDLVPGLLSLEEMTARGLLIGGTRSFTYGFSEYQPGTKSSREDFAAFVKSIPVGNYRIPWVRKVSTSATVSGDNSTDHVCSGILEFTVIDPNDLVNRD